MKTSGIFPAFLGSLTEAVRRNPNLADLPRTHPRHFRLVVPVKLLELLSQGQINCLQRGQIKLSNLRLVAD
jgi:hypothetical protein